MEMMDVSSLESENHRAVSALEPAESSKDEKLSSNQHRLKDGPSSPRIAVCSNTHEKCGVVERPTQSPVPSSTDGELSSDSAPNSPKGFYGAVERDALEKISDDDSLDLNSEPPSPVTFHKESGDSRKLHSVDRDKRAKELSDNVHRDTTLKQTPGDRSQTNSGKDIAQSFLKCQLSSGLQAYDVFSDDEQEGIDSDGGNPGLDAVAANSQKEKSEHKENMDMLSIHDRLDLSLRGSHDDHGELDYEEDVDDGLDSSKRENDDSLDISKRDEKEGNLEDKVHCSVQSKHPSAVIICI